MQRPPLDVDLVHGLQPPGEGRLLPGALALERLDLATERLHVARRALDPRVEPGDLALLVRQPLLDQLQLRQHRRLACPRLRRLLLLLAQLLLGLLELLLLGRDLVVGLLAGGLRRRDADQQTHGEAGNGNDRGRARRYAAARDVRRRPVARPHRSVRPRASQPPNPPSMVPANISTTTVCGRRNVRCSSPSVWLTSGSRRGPAIVYTAISTQIAITAPTRPCSIPCSSSGKRTTSSGAPTRRMISSSWRRACSTSVVAVVTVRIAAIASTAPTPRPMTSSRRWPRASRSIQSMPPPTSSASDSPDNRAMSPRALSGVVPSAVSVTSSDAGSGFAGSCSATLASLPSTCLSVPSASALLT